MSRRFSHPIPDFWASAEVVEKFPRSQTVVQSKKTASQLRKNDGPKANGAGEGNRTLVASLEGWSFATKLHPHRNQGSLYARIATQKTDFSEERLRCQSQNRYDGCGI